MFLVCISEPKLFKSFANELLTTQVRLIIDEEDANYLEAEEKGRCIDDTEPILHPPVHSIRKPYKVMHCSTLLIRYN